MSNKIITKLCSLKGLEVIFYNIILDPLDIFELNLFLYYKDIGKGKATTLMVMLFDINDSI